MENQKKSKSKILIGVVIVIVIALGGFGCDWYYENTNFVSTDDAQISGDVINASPKLSGEIVTENFKEGDKVKKGQVLFTLETDQVQAQLNQAQAGLDTAMAQLAKLEGGARSQEIAGAQSTVDQATAAYNGAQANKDNLTTSLNNLQSEYNTLISQMSGFVNPSTGSYDATYAMSQLDSARKVNAITEAQYTVKAEAVEQLFASKQQLENQISQLQGQINSVGTQISAAKAGIDAANSKLSLTNAGASDKDIAIAEDQVKSAQANYDLVKLNLDNTQVKAPIDGTIVQINSHVGDTVAPGQGVMAIVDFSKLQVTAYVLESDIEKIKLDQDAKLSVDSFSGTTFDGKVENIGLATSSVFNLFSSSNNTGNYTKVSQRVPVKISIDAGNNTVIPGMSVTAKIKIK
jgi:membrane fusion protein (multidrug efflux system)